MFDLDPSLPAELTPLSWLIGVWEGTGVIDYGSGDERVSVEFGQRVSFSHDGAPYLNYSSSTWLLGTPKRGDTEAVTETPAADDPETRVTHATETGYWRLSRAMSPGDPGPGLLPAQHESRPFTSPQAVETLRVPEGGFPIEVVIAHPDSVMELYLGRIDGPRVDLATDYVVRSATAHELTASSRMYGLVDGHLLWAWDIAANGAELASHASARLARAE